MKKLLLSLAVGLFCGLAHADTGDIFLSSNFQENSGRPLDARITVADSTARLALTSVQVYNGMMVYQRSDNTNWQLQGSTFNWVNITFGGGSGGNGAFTSWYLKDSSNGQWNVTLDLAGHLNTASVSSIPSGALAPHTLVTQDNNFNLWTIGIDTAGHLTTSPMGSTAQSITDLLMNDSTKITWLITVDTGGHLVTQ